MCSENVGQRSVQEFIVSFGGFNYFGNMSVDVDLLSASASATSTCRPHIILLTSIGFRSGGSGKRAESVSMTECDRQRVRDQQVFGRWGAAAKARRNEMISRDARRYFAIVAELQRLSAVVNDRCVFVNSPDRERESESKLMVNYVIISPASI